MTDELNALEREARDAAREQDCRFIGTAAAIALVAGSVATHLTSAKLQSNAANKAAKIQTDAGERAANLQRQTAQDNIAFAREMYGTSQKNLAPYIQTGNSALMKLSDAMGLGGGNVGGFQLPAGGTTVTPVTGQAPPPMAGARGTVPATAFKRDDQPAPPVSSVAAPPVAPVVAPTASAPAAGRTSGYITVQAPTGATRMVPESQKEFWVSRGAKVVS